jgi:ATP synthase protein I
MPILLVVFTLLGFAAGVKTMVRTAKEMQEGKLPGASALTDEGENGRGD